MTTVCTSYDGRKTSPSNPVARKVVTVTILNTASNGNTTVGMDGRIMLIIADVPDLTTSANVTLDIKDEDGTALAAQKTELTKAAKTLASYQAAATPHGAVVAGDVTFTCTAADAQTGNKTINLIVYYL